MFPVRKPVPTGTVAAGAVSDRRTRVDWLISPAPAIPALSDEHPVNEYYALRRVRQTVRRIVPRSPLTHRALSELPSVQGDLALINRFLWIDTLILLLQPSMGSLLSPLRRRPGREQSKPATPFSWTSSSRLRFLLRLVGGIAAVP